MRSILPILLLLLSFTARAEDLMMVRSTLSFPEAMVTLQNTIRDYGYTLSRVQRVDIGLTSFGFKTDKYRIVFFGKAEENRRMIARRPELVAYLPLKIAIFAEEDDTLLVAANPVKWLEGLVEDEELRIQFERWRNDLQAILEDVRRAEE